MEILFTIFYAIFIGFYNIFKKLAVRKTNESVVLVLFTSVAFLLSLIWIPFGLKIPLKFILIFALKGFLLATSWFILLKILKTADLSVVTVTRVLSSVLTFILGVSLFSESANAWQIVGMAIVILSVAGINLCNKNSDGKITILNLILLLLTAVIITASNVIDKYTTTYLTQYQVQFWCLLFVCLFSWMYFLIDCLKSKEFLIKKNDVKNFWIYLIGIFLFVGDIWLFQAYKVPGSQMITISVISKLNAVVTVLAGIIIFKEKKIWQKLVLTLLAICGVVMISVL